MAVQNEDLMTGIGEVLAGMEEYQNAEDFYDGDMDEVFASAKLARLLKATGDQFRINLAKTAVDVVADRLEIAAVTVSGSDDTADGANDALSKVLNDEVWDANLLDMRSKDWNLRAAEYGDAYVFVWPGDDYEDDARSVVLTYNNPKTCRIVYDEETGTRPLYAIKLWKEGKHWRANLYYPDVIERYWTRVDNSKPDNPVAWEEYSDASDDLDPDTNLPTWPLENPWGCIPVFHLRNGEPYGTPEHKAGYGAQNAINKLVVTQMSTTDYHSFPQRYALVEADADHDDEDDDSAWIDDPTLASRREDSRSKLNSGPAELWYMSGVKEVGQFETADPSNFLTPAEFYIRLMAQVTTTPLHYFDPSGDVPSGESLRAANAPLDKKVADRQRRLGVVWEEILSFAMEILGHLDCVIDVRWAPPGVVEDADGWATVAAKVAAGVPLRQALLEVGYTTEQCDAWGIGESVSDALILRQINLLTQLGMAVQGLSVAETFNILTSEDIRGVVENVLGRAETADAAT